MKGEDSHILVMSPKNDKSRTIKPAPFVMDVLKAQRARQAEWRLKAGLCWEGDPQGDFVFTDELGRHLIPDTVYRNLKRVMKSIGLPETRLHDLRHPNVKPKTKSFSTFFEFFQGRTSRSYLGSFPIVQVSCGA